MANLFKMILRLIAFVLCTFPIVTVVCFLNINEEKQIIDSLERLLNFLVPNVKQLNADGLFGIVLARDELNEILKNELPDVEISKKLIEIQDKCDLLINQSSKYLENEEYYKNFVKQIINGKWEIGNNFTTGKLQKLPLYDWSSLSLEELASQAIFKGSPIESESDFCFKELIWKGSGEEVHDCIPGKFCSSFMFDTASSSGYPLTHKLLYIQIAKSLNCAIDEPTYKSIAKQLCSRILQEFRSLDLLSQTVIGDLYTEQMLLCGREGFAEFLQQSYREKLRGWQSSEGCYRSHNSRKTLIQQNTTQRWRTKREDAEMSNSCSSHFSGLATAAFGLHLRYLIASDNN